MTDLYTWATFQAKVRENITVNASRQNVQTFVTNTLRAAVISLQDYIPAYRKGHETVYHASDFVTEGYASKAVLPPQAQVQDAFLIDTSCDKRFPLAAFPWKDRFNLVNNHTSVNDGHGRIAIDPYAYTYFVYPEVKDCWVVSVNWDGLKLEFEDDEATPFDEPMALVVAEFIQAKIAREVNRDVALHNSYMQSFERGRRDLYRTAQDRGRVKS
jgi:hypothetical protein